MNKREGQKRFAEKSNIRNSEFDRMNTNATRYANPIMRGKNPLPPDLERKEDTYLKDTLLKIASAGLGVLFFIFVVPLARFVVSEAFYDGAMFLLMSLLVTILVAVGCYYVGQK